MLVRILIALALVGCSQAQVGVRKAAPVPRPQTVVVPWRADATRVLEAAFLSGVPQVEIPFVGKPWVTTRPLRLCGNQVVIFKPGVVLMAQEGEFRGVNDCLLTVEGVSNVTLLGYGATLRMRKADYAGPGYEHSQWRHVLKIINSSDVTVRGMTFASGGGDGVCIEPSWGQPPCHDIEIRDVTCDGNMRQGISVISARRVLIENCVWTGTSGNNPQAGIDIEPYLPTHVVQDIVIRNCQALGNAGSGLFVNVECLNQTSKPVGITFENCLVRGSGAAGIRVKSKSVKGRILYRNCTVIDSGPFVDWGVPILDFKDCRWSWPMQGFHVAG